MEGDGTLWFFDGDEYHGTFHEDEMHGTVCGALGRPCSFVLSSLRIATRPVGVVQIRGCPYGRPQLACSDPLCVVCASRPYVAQGTFRSFATGEIYVGEFAHDLREGMGTLVGSSLSRGFVRVRHSLEAALRTSLRARTLPDAL